MNRLSTSIIAILLILIATTTGMARTEISVGVLTKKQAKEKYGITMHARKNGDAGIKVWLEFKKEGWLEKFTYAELEMKDSNGQHLLSAKLQPNAVHHRQSPEKTTVYFSSSPDQLTRCSFLVVCYGSNEGDVGYYLNLKDFLDMENPITENIAAELPAQASTPESTARRKFNQVFVKVIVPVTSRTPKQDGPVVESWVAEQLKQMGESEYFAVTDWVPVCDALLEDDIVDNDVWDGRLDGSKHDCPVGGDIPERESGRVLVRVSGWGGVEANIKLLDEPGTRAVRPVQILVGKEKKLVKTEDRLPYVAVIIVPPPQ